MAGRAACSASVSKHDCRERGRFAAALCLRCVSTGKRGSEEEREKVCACVREGGGEGVGKRERERERETDRQTDRQTEGRARECQTAAERE